MKHLAKIQTEFLKQAAWNDMSYEEQKEYLTQHPRSKKKITARPESSTDREEIFSAAKKLKAKKILADAESGKRVHPTKVAKAIRQANGLDKSTSSFEYLLSDNWGIGDSLSKDQIESLKKAMTDPETVNEAKELAKKHAKWTGGQGEFKINDPLDREEQKKHEAEHEKMFNAEQKFLGTILQNDKLKNTTWFKQPGSSNFVVDKNNDFNHKFKQELDDSGMKKFRLFSSTSTPDYTGYELTVPKNEKIDSNKIKDIISKMQKDMQSPDIKINESGDTKTFKFEVKK